MTHCRGCGGNARDIPSRDFVHLVGCGWRHGKKENRHTPSAEPSQKAIITHAYQAAQKTRRKGDSVPKQVNEFIRHLREELDNYNED